MPLRRITGNRASATRCTVDIEDNLPTDEDTTPIRKRKRTDEAEEHDENTNPNVTRQSRQKTSKDNAAKSRVKRRRVEPEEESAAEEAEMEEAKPPRDTKSSKRRSAKKASKREDEGETGVDDDDASPEATKWKQRYERLKALKTTEMEAAYAQLERVSKAKEEALSQRIELIQTEKQRLESRLAELQSENKKLREASETKLRSSNHEEHQAHIASLEHENNKLRRLVQQLKQDAESVRASSAATATAVATTTTTTSSRGGGIMPPDELQQIVAFYQTLTALDVSVDPTDPQRFHCVLINADKRRILSFSLTSADEVFEYALEDGAAAHAAPYDAVATLDRTLRELPPFLQESIYFDKAEAPLFLSKVLHKLYVK